MRKSDGYIGIVHYGGSRTVEGIRHMLVRGIFTEAGRQRFPVYIENVAGEASLEGCAGVIGFLWSADRAKALAEKGIAAVNVSNTAGPLPQVANLLSDDRAIGELAGDYLWKRGYRNFLVVGHGGTAFSRERQEGFAVRVGTLGGSVRRIEIPLALSGSFLPPNRYLEAMWSLLGTVLMSMPMDTGIFAINDVIAWPILRLLEDRLPERMYTCGVLGVDNSGAALDDPHKFANLTSIIPGFERVGREALGLLLEYGGARDALASVERRFPPLGIKERASTAGMACEDSVVANVMRTMWTSLRAGRRCELAEMARERSMSGRTLEHRFQAVLGRSAREVQFGFRMDLGKELLRNPTLSIAEVAEGCGYAEISSFSNAFRKMTGMAPSEWRKTGGKHDE